MATPFGSRTRTATPFTSHNRSSCQRRKAACQIEERKPEPRGRTNNWFLEDGYGSFTSTGNAYGGGSYSNCSDPSAPGVGPIRAYLASLKPAIKPNCDAGHYYLLNNYNPGFFGDGTDAYTDTNSNNTPFTIPPTSQRSIGDVLLENNVSWKSYNDQWDTYLTDPYQLDLEPGVDRPEERSVMQWFCNGFKYQTQALPAPPSQAWILPAHHRYRPALQGHPLRQSARRVLREAQRMG